MENCLFCKIIKKNIPSYTIYENDDVYAFLDISQATPGHTLIIPKKHSVNLLDTSKEMIIAVNIATQEIAKLLVKKLNACGVNIASNAGECAGQSVFHYHVHVIPRYGLNDDYKIHQTSHKASADELLLIQQKIVN